MNVSNAIYLRGQGKPKIGTYDANNNFLGYNRVGDTSKCALIPKVTWIEHRENQSGLQLLDAYVQNTFDLDIEFDLMVPNGFNLGLALSGTTTQGGGTGSTTFSNTVLPAQMTVGLDYVFGPAGATITSLVDSSATPVTVATTDYTVNTDGTLTMKNLTGYTLPLKASGNEVAYTTVNILNQLVQDVAIRLEGLNTVTGKAVVLDLPRVRLNPGKQTDLISAKDLVKWEFTGKVLMPANAINSGVLGGYGSITLVS
ncbi:hypothetical protein ACGYU5_15155 [Burkholderia pseudomallei]|uniref:phage tail tube protein n=1 Tax=Burkholderia pseudomallei TaxID=28450 RepID=UPI00193CFCA5|nr:hypothetical protein [Burkholderia pseudomallei]QRM23519.1 hypothetical protein JQX71_04340 [Burkholderia pseudomallei]